jgi:hypothetical protein
MNGAGIDPNFIRAKAIQKGLTVPTPNSVKKKFLFGDLLPDFRLLQTSPMFQGRVLEWML